jgi:hypothetical protein
MCRECCEWIPLEKLPTHAAVCIGAIPFDKCTTIEGIVEERR